MPRRDPCTFDHQTLDPCLTILLSDFLGSSVLSAIIIQLSAKKPNADHPHTTGALIDSRVGGARDSSHQELEDLLIENGRNEATQIFLMRCLCSELNADR